MTLCKRINVEAVLKELSNGFTFHHVERQASLSPLRSWQFDSLSGSNVPSLWHLFRSETVMAVGRGNIVEKRSISESITKISKSVNKPQ